GSSVSTTEAWFREFNQNTKELNKNNFDDDDSETPYFVNSYKSLPKHPKLVPNQQSSIPPVSKSPRHGNFKKRRESSGSDSYRSVIDDLTLKNQKLRQKLRKLERVHSKSLHKEKLFEVRYYQMPREKRHQLEEYLRQFAVQLSTPSTTQVTQNSINVNDSTENAGSPDSLHIKASDKSKMKQVVRAIENVFTTKPSLNDHYLKDQEDSDPQGYVYLNLLTNMAQLHTMSVTLPFVKQAIRTFSNCLELNEDGTKVRWRTGLDHIKPDQSSTNKNKYVDTIISGGSSENISRSGGVSEISSSTGDKQSDSSSSNPFAESIQNYSSDPKNSANAYITPSSLTSSNASKPINQQIKSTPPITHYRPVFLHRNVSSSSSSSDETSSENDQHDGPVIYYEGGLFCTDFSRDLIIDDNDKPTTSSGTQFSPVFDNSITDDNNIDIFKERWNVPRYERATNSILGGNNIILNETSEEDSTSGQEADDESLTKLCDLCDPNDHYSLTCPHISIDGAKTSMIAVDDRCKENSMDTKDGLNKILMEKDIEFTFDRNYGEINDWNDNISKDSISSSSTNSNSCIPDYKRLHTTKVPGVITDDNFMVLVQTSHPMKKRISHSKESSVDCEDIILNSSSSDNSMDMKQQNNERSQQSPESHKIISTKLFQLPPSMSPQPRISPPPGVRGISYATSSNTSSLDSGGGSSGYGSSSSSSSSSETSRDNSYLLRNSTLLQLSQSNNSNLKSSQYDEIQDMELDSLSSDSSGPSPFINIDADEDEELEIEDGHHHHKSRIEESILGKNLRLQDAAIEERRKLADKAAPQEQRLMYLKEIMASSRAVVEALEDNKNSNNVIDGGMDALPTVHLPFFNQRNVQQQSNIYVNNLGINQNNNINNNNNDNNNL
ncbi:frequency clock protein, partial [Glomus cerebriforme]